MESQKREVTLTQLPTVLPRSGYVPVSDLAFWIGSAESTVKQYIRKHDISHAVIGGKWIVDIESLWTELFKNTRQ